MTKSTRKRLKLLAISCLMAFLFVGGLALCGSDFIDFPWGQVIGAPMLGLFGFIGQRLDGKYESMQ